MTKSAWAGPSAGHRSFPGHRVYRSGRGLHSRKFGSSRGSVGSFLLVGLDQETRMHQDDHPARKAVAPREARQDNAVVDDRQGRQITPTDGSVAGSGAMVCVFCAPCQRWIDCYDGIPPEVAHQRHGLLFH
jgi:hypothetical protein